MKVAFVSNRFENLLEDIVFLDAFHLKTQNTTFKSFTDDSTVLQYQFYYFHKPHRFDGGRFFSQITTLKTVPSDEKSNCRTCAEGCQMPFNVQFWQISIPNPRKVILMTIFREVGDGLNKENFPWEGYGYFNLLILNMNKFM